MGRHRPRPGRDRRANLGGDFVIVRADGTPLYHFAVVVDDAAMEISHIIRGEDHISNTPKHILLFRALGHDVPQFAHLPLILNPDRTKMSKRKTQTAVADYRAQGFIREALVNYLALLGWSSGTEEEILSIDEIVQRFDLDDVHKGGAVFDRERLEWLNGQWIRRLDPTTSSSGCGRSSRPSSMRAGSTGCRPTRRCGALLPMVRERMPRLARSATGRLPVGRRAQRRAGGDRSQALGRGDDPGGLKAAREVIAKVGGVSFEADELEPPLRELAEERGWKPGDLFMAIRVAITGRTATPPLFDTLVALGYERTLDRLDRAIVVLRGGMPAGAEGEIRHGPVAGSTAERREPEPEPEDPRWTHERPGLARGYSAAWESLRRRRDPARCSRRTPTTATTRTTPTREAVRGADAITSDWLDGPRRRRHLRQPLRAVRGRGRRAVAVRLEPLLHGRDEGEAGARVTATSICSRSTRRGGAPCSPSSSWRRRREVPARNG